VTERPDDHTSPAWYAAAGRTRRRDWWTILHPPYTAWHLGYVLLGAGLAAHVDDGRLAATLVAFGLAVGVAAHALDELRGRPLDTSIPSPVLIVVAVVALAGAIAVGGLAITWVGWNLLWFIGTGSVFVVAYNLELWDGRLHNDVVFAAAWGAFPVLTAYYIQTGTIRPGAVFASAFAFGLSRAQRTLSVEARTLRRRTASVEGRRTRRDGTVEPLDRTTLLQPLERALAALSWSVCALGIGLVLARAGH
jgi:hypothetical protein